MKALLVFVFLFAPFFDIAQTITTFAGTGVAGNTGDGTAATTAKINYPIGGVFDRNGNYYFALGTTGNCIRKVSPSGIITTVAGISGSSGFSGDSGQATSAKLSNPQAVTVDTSGNIYIADASNHRIRKVDISTGVITTIAGNGTATYGGDSGMSTASRINYPLDLCFDAIGNLYFADAGNARIRCISSSGVITTVAGIGVNGVGSDSIAATSSKISTIEGLFTDDTGNVYIGDAGRLRKIKVATGIINTIAGSYPAGSTGDGGPASAAKINPVKITRDRYLNIYVAERAFNKIRRIDVNTGIITTIVGTGAADYGGDGGMADTAKINYPAGVSIDNCGNLYIADAHNWRVRKVTHPANLNIALSAPTIASIGSSVAVTAAVVSAGVNYSIKWYNKGILFNTTTSPSVTYTKTQCTDSITAVVYGCSDSATSNLKVVGCNVGVGSLPAAVSSCTVYPNPVTNELHIEAIEPIENISISNLLGQVVIQNEYKNPVKSLSIGTHDLPKGMYLVRVSGPDGYRDVQRVVKE